VLPEGLGSGVGIVVVPGILDKILVEHISGTHGTTSKETYMMAFNIEEEGDALTNLEGTTGMLPMRT